MIKKIKTYIKLSIKHFLRSWIFIKPYVKEVEKCYDMSSSELDSYKDKKFLELFREAYDKSPFYKKLYTQAGISKEDIKSLKDITKLPIVTKEMVRQHSEEILTIPKWKTISGHTSGTTGTPLCLYQDWPSIWHSRAYDHVSRKKLGYSTGQRLLSLRGQLDKTITSLMLHISNTLYLSSYNINPSSIIDYYNKISDFKPHAIEGYPSSLYSLAVMLKDRGLRLNISVAFTSSETLLDYQRKIIEEVLNCEIFDHYGMTEKTVYLVENKNHEGYYDAPGFCHMEITEDGEIGTNLINKGFPLIRYKSSDILETEENINGHKTIKAINGRLEDALTLKDGSKIMRLGFVFKNIEHVKYSQLVVDKQGKLHINVVPEEGFSEEDELKIRNNLLARIGKDNIDYDINLIEPDGIIKTKRGKFKYIIDLSKID